ncbi:hypothetical protein BBD42_19320 [Paenibacillus sp. BIHB 4019]|uniref:SLH domain-containing protein n=2 Tax=Paenibacillus sp. BIHB 4019 TaxID=1870819 RepID=A0A1B2DL10_9BACL|nr:hypothetical protein BBD42_19320 [Paenibacillus sp. BIHB 4019]
MVVIDPNLELQENTDYYVDVSSGLFIFSDGNHFLSNENASWYFKTEDTSPPVLSYTFPENGDSIAPVSGGYTLQFNEEVLFGYGEIQLFKQGVPTPIQTFAISGSPNSYADYASYSGATIHLLSDLRLEQETDYYIHITSGTFVDRSHNPFAGLLDSSSWHFTTMDEYPELIGFGPYSLSGLPVNPDTDLMFSFNEPVQLNNGTISIRRTDNLQVAREFTISNGHISGASASFSGNSFILNPDSKLDDFTTYFINITSGAITDLNGNPFFGLFDSYWSFSTGDSTPPVLTYTFPENGDSIAPVSGGYMLQFNEEVLFGYGEIQLFKQGVTTPIQTFAISGSPNSYADYASHSGATILLFSDVRLEQETDYYIHITSGTFVDRSHNPFAGLLDSSSWHFTTMDEEPFLMNFLQQSLSGLPTNTELGFLFNEPVQLNNGTISIRRTDNLQVAREFTISNGHISGASASFSGNSFILNPDIDLDGFTSYFISFSNGALSDLNGNPLIGHDDSYWNFSTGAQTHTGSNQPSPTTTPSNPVVVPGETAPIIANSAQVNVITVPFKTGQEKIITLPANQNGSAALIYYYDPKYKQWIALPTQHDGNTLHADMPAESWVAVIENQSVYQPVDTASNWANKDILKLMSLNIIQGYEDQTFKPNQVTNRYEMAVMMAKVLGLPLASTDVTALNSLPDSGSIPEWAKPAVAALLQNNIMLGSAQGFQGSESITRAQLAAMLGRILPAAQNNAASSFKDQSSIPAWASDGIQKAIELGIFQGYPDGSFQPDKTLTRAEMAAVITRLMDYLIQQPNQ